MAYVTAELRAELRVELRAEQVARQELEAKFEAFVSSIDAIIDARPLKRKLESMQKLSSKKFVEECLYQRLYTPETVARAIELFVANRKHSCSEVSQFELFVDNAQRALPEIDVEGQWATQWGIARAAEPPSTAEPDKPAGCCCRCQ